MILKPMKRYSENWRRRNDVDMNDYDIYFDWEKSSEDLPERYKTCGRCIHDGDCPDIVGSYCYNCKRNPNDHRIDWFEAKRD